jgi:hypothetical protein
MKDVSNGHGFCETADFHQNVSGSRGFHEMCEQKPMFSRRLSVITAVVSAVAELFWNVPMAWDFMKHISNGRVLTKCIGNDRGHLMRISCSLSEMFKDFMKCASNLPRISRNSLTMWISRNVSAKARNVGNV